MSSLNEFLSGICKTILAVVQATDEQMIAFPIRCEFLTTQHFEFKQYVEK